MTEREGNLFGGIVLMLFGAATALYASQNYVLGSFGRMGPGMFPTILGIILLALGGAIALSGLTMRQQGERAELDWRSFFAIIAGMISFVLLLNSFGLVPAIFALVALSSRADGRLSWVQVGITSVVLSFIAVSIFVYAMQFPLNIISFPG